MTIIKSHIINFILNYPNYWFLKLFYFYMKPNDAIIFIFRSFEHSSFLKKELSTSILIKLIDFIIHINPNESLINFNYLRTQSTQRFEQQSILTPLENILAFINCLCIYYDKDEVSEYLINYNKNILTYQLHNTFFSDLKTNFGSFSPLFISVFHYKKDLFLKIADINNIHSIKIAFSKICDFIYAHEKRMSALKFDDKDKNFKKKVFLKLEPFIDSCYFGIHELILYTKENYPEEIFNLEDYLKVSHIIPILNNIDKNKIDKNYLISNYLYVRGKEIYWDKYNEQNNLIYLFNFLKENNYDFNHLFNFNNELHNILEVALIYPKIKPNSQWLEQFIQIIVAYGLYIRTDITWNKKQYSITDITKINRHYQFVPMLEKYLFEQKIQQKESQINNIKKTKKI